MSDMGRRAFNRLLLSSAATMPASARLFSHKRPNILLITADDLGLQLGRYGDATVPTPEIDRLAAMGLQFINAYVSSSSCSSSRSSILTGLFPHQNGQIGLAHLGFQMHDHIVTLPQILKRAGFVTGVIGKIHVNPIEKFSMDLMTNKFNTRDIEGVAKSVGEFINAAGERPWFLLASYADPHKPYQEKWQPENPLLPANVKGFPEHDGLLNDAAAIQIAGYYNAIQKLDRGIGLLLRVLRDLRQEEDTIIILVGDHGPPFYRGKTTSYDFGVRTPFLLYWPKMTPGKSAHLVSTIDIVPTICEACGITWPYELPGQSLFQVPFAKAWRQELATEFHVHFRLFRPHRTIRDGRYKLIYNLLPGKDRGGRHVDGCQLVVSLRDGSAIDSALMPTYPYSFSPPTYELYDLQNDPYEFHDLYGGPEMAGVFAKLRDRLSAWQVRTGDPFTDPGLAEKMFLHFQDAAHPKEPNILPQWFPGDRSPA